MSVTSRTRYLARVLPAYLTSRTSHLTFWHEAPELNERAFSDSLGEYYMTFSAKADFQGHYDEQGVPMLDYQGSVGLQYNPIAIAQWGLGNYNLYSRTGDHSRKNRFLTAADWLMDNLTKNSEGVLVWKHEFDWEYRTPLKAGWYSALAQGQGISVLVRAHEETGELRYRDSAEHALESFHRSVTEGGVSYKDEDGLLWFEETIVEPPTHILNGFIWATWGLHDYFLHTKDSAARTMFDEGVRTMVAKLPTFDTGFWSLYEQSGTRLKMLASPFYHRLHIVQLLVMHRLTKEPRFLDYANRWRAYADSKLRSRYALCYKAAFKLLYY